MPSGVPVPYAYLCTECKHLASDHRLAEGGDLMAGPYVCRECACEQPQHGPFEPMTRREYQAWKDAYA